MLLIIGISLTIVSLHIGRDLFMEIVVKAESYAPPAIRERLNVKVRVSWRVTRN